MYSIELAEYGGVPPHSSFGSVRHLMITCLFLVFFMDSNCSNAGWNNYNIGLMPVLPTVSSREIAELTGKEIKHIHRDITYQLINGLYSVDIKGILVSHRIMVRS